MTVSKNVLMALLILSYATWGGGMIAMKYAFESFTAMQVVFARVAFAGVIYLASDVRRDTLPAQIRPCPLPLVVVSQSPINAECNRVLRDNQQAASLYSSLKPMRKLLSRLCPVRARRILRRKLHGSLMRASDA